LGQLFRSEMRKIKSDRIELVRGKGLLNAVIIKPKGGQTAWDVCIAMKNNGLIAKPTHQHIIRFAPPLVINEEQILEAAGIIRATIEQMD
jgi:ornithine--oxo-acid transaminase